MSVHTVQSGQSLLELLCAIAVFTIGVVVIGYLILDAQTALRQHVEYTKAQLFAHECIEVANIIRGNSFEKLASGVHGYELNGSNYELSDELIQAGKFTRSLSVEDIDSETKHIECAVEWDISPSRTGSISLAVYLTDWKQSKGNADSIVADISDAMLFASSTGLGGVTLQNTGDESMFLTGMTVEWNGNAALEFVSISGTTIFSASSTEGVSSETTIPVSNYELVSNVMVPIDVFGFSDSVSGTDFILTFIFEDGTQKRVLIEE